MLIGFTVVVVEEAYAYNSYDSDGDFWRWPGQSTTFDYAAGISETWWRNEIIYANAIWDASSVGADFTFTSSTSSANDWLKSYEPWNTQIAYCSAPRILDTRLSGFLAKLA
jgi:hypothetical protein